MSSFSKKLSNSAYTAYIIHPIIVVSLTILFSHLSIAPTLKLLIVAPLAVSTCFLLSTLLIKLPYATKVL
ncbi:hypothetical protein LCL95_00960 [Bacillus timonensis]|nr:hypothetical protein [Bacillus timonensis]